MSTEMLGIPATQCARLSTDFATLGAFRKHRLMLENQVHTAGVVAPQQHRFELLDAMRGIGALLVATLHTPPTMHKLTPFDMSFLAVDMFFCLSGFVLAFSYEEQLKRSMSVGRFMLLRFVRLYPLYLLGLVLGLCAFSARNHLLPVEQRMNHEIGYSFLLGLFLLPSLFHKTITTNAFPFNPPSWSLFFEMVANLLFAIALTSLSKTKAVFVAAAAVCFAAMVYLMGIKGLPLALGWSVGPLFLFGFLRVGYGFSFGVILFRAYRRWPEARLPLRMHGWAALLVVAVTSFLLSFETPFMESVPYQLGLIGLVLPTIIFLGAGIQVPASFRKCCFILGTISYPLYILHLPLFAPLYFMQRLHIHGLAYQAVSPIAVLAVAFLSYWIALQYELPVRRRLMIFVKQTRLWQ